MHGCLLLSVLREPAIMANLELADWDLLTRQAYAASFLARLYHLAEKHEVIDRIPSRPLQHMKSNWFMYLKQCQSMDYEKKFLSRACAELGIDPIFLKGAAYHFAELPNATGRLLSDIDLLVPSETLAELEAKLIEYGWLQSCEDAYDEHYFRAWMHEIPPLHHAQRESSLDVHHTILPPTAKYKPNAALLFEELCPVANGGYVLSPEDMVIHSATHLFHEGEFEQGLRGLYDIDRLLVHWGNEESQFWERLVARAQELDLAKPLYYGLHYSRLLLQTPVPDSVMVAMSDVAPGGIMGRVMDVLFLHALMPDHPSCNRPFTRISRFSLFIRSHYLKMPMRLLLPHLVRKAWKRRFGKPVEAQEAVAGN